MRLCRWFLTRAYYGAVSWCAHRNAPLRSFSIDHASLSGSEFRWDSVPCSEAGSAMRARDKLDHPPLLGSCGETERLIRFQCSVCAALTPAPHAPSNSVSRKSRGPRISATLPSAKRRVTGCVKESAFKCPNAWFNLHSFIDCHEEHFIECLRG
jgi:hypothetical protein